jgi:hypothetical protein
LLARTRLFSEANRRYLRRPDDELSQWIVEQLVRAGAAAIENATLVNRG